MLKLAEVFQDYMVLQHGAAVKIWGKTEPEEAVNVSIQNLSAHTIADKDGKWSAEVGPLIPSEEESMIVRSGEEEINLFHIAVGEVWIAAGQSNMEFFMKYEKHYSEELEKCENHRLRFFDVPEVCFEGQKDAFDYSEFGRWRICNPENLGYFNGVGYYFQKELESYCKMPLGIIGCSWGGTTSSVWMNKESVRRLDNIWYQQYQKKINGLDFNAYYEAEKKNPMNDRGSFYHSPFDAFIMPRTPSMKEIGEFMGGAEPPAMDPDHLIPQTVPGCLFEYMVKTIAPFTAKGVLWYQGESDDEAAGQQEIYKDMLKTLIEDWRAIFANEQLPFFVVQLPGFKQWFGFGNQDWGKLRKAQEEAVKEVTNAYLCSISDCGEERDIHPKNKKTVGKRLSLLARKYAYGETELLADAPIVKESYKNERGIILEFENAEGGLYIEGKSLHALQVSDGSKELNFTYEIEDDRLIINPYCPKDSKLTIRFAQTDYYEVNLYNQSHVPAIPFEIEVIV